MGQDCLHNFRAGLVPEKCDHGAGVQYAVHRRLSSFEISRCFWAAKALLLVRTWAYFPRNSLTRFCRREESELNVREGAVVVLITGF